MKKLKEKLAILMIAAIFVCAVNPTVSAFAEIKDQTAITENQKKASKSDSEKVLPEDKNNSEKELQRSVKKVLAEAELEPQVQEDKYELIKDLKLNIISPENKTMKVSELPSSIRIFVFGDLGDCNNTKGVIQQFGTQLRGMNIDVCYLDIEGRDSNTIIRGANESQADKNYYLCEDLDKVYEKKVWEFVEGSGLIMPFVFVVGRNNETVFASSFIGNSIASFVQSIKESIIAEYPEENIGLTPLTDKIYMFSGTSRSFPIANAENYSYESSDTHVVSVWPEIGWISANSKGVAEVTVKSGDEQKTITVEVIAEKDDYSYEWDVLKIVNAERIKQGLDLLSSIDDLQKVADVRSLEVSSLSDHNRPDGTTAGTILDEIGIKDYADYGENIAWGQNSPEEAMNSWMNSPGHKAQILSSKYSHIGIGYDKNRNSWVQFFLKCRGTQESIQLQKGKISELEEGGTINDLNYRISMTCSACGTSELPVIEEMCSGFNANQLGKQEVTVNLGDWSESFTINVLEKKPVEIPSELVESIVITSDTISFKVGENRKLTVDITPTNADYKGLNWFSTNPDIVAVDENGKITAVSVGEAEIYCISEGGGNVESNHCKVQVKTSDNSSSGDGSGGSSSGGSTGGSSSGGSTGGSSSGGSTGGSSSGGSTGGSSSGGSTGGSSSGGSTGGSSSGGSTGGSSSGGSTGGSSSGGSTGGSSSGGSTGGSSSGGSTGGSSSGGSTGGSSSGGSTGGSSSGGSSGGSSSGGSSGGGSRGSSSRGSSASSAGGPGTSSSLPGYVIKGTWAQHGDLTWEFINTAGVKLVNEWAAVENPYALISIGQQPFDWFRFDENGRMITGWYFDAADGYWYYLNPVSDNTLGKMMTGWVTINGQFYYFNQNSDGHRGRMYVNEMTPDGYYVDGNGVWNGF